MEMIDKQIGNTSLTTIQVPNFFLNRHHYNMETFNVKTKKRYFKESELFRKTKDLNLSNNPRNLLNKFENFNKTKYVPPYRSISNNFVSTQDLFKFRQDTNEGRQKQQLIENVKKENPLFKIPKEIIEYQKYEDYTKKHQTNFEKPDFGQTLRSNINSIVDRINSNYDRDKCSTSKDIPDYMTHINSRITLDNSNERGELIPIENEADKFQKTLSNKFLSLKLDRKCNEKVLKGFHKNTETLEKVINKNKTCSDQFFNTTQQVSGINANTRASSLYKTAENRTNYGSNNNFGNSLYSNVNFNKLSDTRDEFSQLRAEKVSYRRKDKLEPDDIDPNSYNSYKHKDVYCENYNTYGGVCENKPNNRIIAFLK